MLLDNRFYQSPLKVALKIGAKSCRNEIILDKPNSNWYSYVMGIAQKRQWSYKSEEKTNA